jgi:NodT family efflux transporter outer membrane factor (OMF) lipoprotein
MHYRLETAMNFRIHSTIVSLLVALLVAGCANMQGLAPESSMRNADALASGNSLSSTPVMASAWPSAEWWKTFGDPQLDQLITEALSGSPTLKVAAARTRQALAFAQIAKAPLYPQIEGSFSSQYQRFSEQGLIPPPFAGTWNSINQLQVSLNWELDFWGKNRSAYESALGQARSAEVDEYAARLALSTSIAQAYVQMQRAYLLLDVADKTLKEREQIYTLTRDRNEAGIDSRLELKQAESALPATREVIAQLNETIDLTRNQIAALMGQGPDRGLAIARPAASALTTVALPTNVPAELLGRRPDVIAQRWRVEAAQHEIDSAKAEFYPNVNLLAFVGFSSIGTGGFLSSASRTLGVGPAITLPIFEGGRLRGNLAGKDAEYDIAVEQYNQALADAMRDVVDQLASFRSVAVQRNEQKQALATTAEAYNLALLRYREGIGNYLQVLSAEQPYLEQQSLDADLQAREIALSINLVRALGGGYQEQAPPSAASQAPARAARQDDAPATVEKRTPGANPAAPNASVANVSH